MNFIMSLVAGWIYGGLAVVLVHTKAWDALAFLAFAALGHFAGVIAEPIKGRNGSHR